MHSHSLENWTHDHVFLGKQHARNERRTWLVVGLTLAMMVAEIVAGTLFGSMALLADGWHMSTHAAAIGIAAFAYRYARRHARDPRFAFGTGKFGELAAFASAVALGIVAIMVAYESLLRISNPEPIAYGEAIAVAIVGLLVNLASAWLLREDHDHGHAHAHDHDHGATEAHSRDNNLRAAYVHVLADAATSVMAIAALILARAFGWVWIDPVVGLIGGAVIASWSYGLIKSAGAVLIDMVPDTRIAGRIRERLETGSDRISDLHLWQVGPGHFAAIISIVTDQPAPLSSYKARLKDIKQLSHVTVEVDRCPHPDGNCARAT